MSSESLGQFREEFGCWLTDHGMDTIGATDRPGVWLCSLDLPALEKAIGELLAEAAGQAVDVALDVRSWTKAGECGPDDPRGPWGAPVPADLETAQVPLPAVLRQVLGDLQRRVAQMEATLPASLDRSRVSTHWAVAWGSTDLNDGVGYVEQYDDEEDAREHVPFYKGGSVVRRTIISLPWEAVPDEAPPPGAPSAATSLPAGGGSGNLPPGQLTITWPAPVAQSVGGVVPLSCGCRVILPARMTHGREVLCAKHGTAVISRTEVWL